MTSIFGGFVPPATPLSAILASPEASQHSAIPGLSEAAFILLYGERSLIPADPFLAQLPALTEPMKSPVGSLAEYCPGYSWAAQLAAALRTLLPSRIAIPPGDDSAAPGTPIDPKPGIYTPSVAPSGGGFAVTVQGVVYENLCLRFQITPATGKPFDVQGFNAVLIVRAFLAQPNNVQGVLTGLVNSILTSGSPA